MRGRELELIPGARSLRGGTTICSWSTQSAMLPVSSPDLSRWTQLMTVAQKLRRAPKPLRSLAVLNERSAVPSLTSKSIISPTSSTGKTKARISSAEKERLRRIARRTAVDPDGITTSAEIKTVGPALADAWTASEARPVPVGEFGEEGMVKAAVKTPVTIARQREIYLSNQVAGGRGLETPDQGTSYNPKEEDHTRLIELAVEEEKAQLAREAAEEERIRILGEVKNARRAHNDGEEFEYAPGMKVGPGEVDEDDEEDEDEDDADAAGPSKKVQKRKTQAQRNKAKRLKEQARLDAIEKTHKRLVASIGGLNGLQASLEKREKQMAEAERLAKLAKKQRERMGLEGGEKVGKHRVVKSRVTVQLGEDLAESLRQVKPEGNLFRDRYLALQRKALIEPRVKQMCVYLLRLDDEDAILTPGRRSTSCAQRSTRSTRTSASSRAVEPPPFFSGCYVSASSVRPYPLRRHARLYMHNDTINIYTRGGRGKNKTIVHPRIHPILDCQSPVVVPHSLEP